jgi:dipeptidyl aminopeptidase/acylaminoacyl peptidase
MRLAAFARAAARAAACTAAYLAVPAPLPAQATPSHFPTSEDLRHTRAIHEPRLAPNGKQVLFAVQDPTVDGAKSHLWLVDIATNLSRQLTFSPKGEGRGEIAGRWLPDNSAVLFLAKRGDNTQLFRLPMQGGEALAYDLKIPAPPAENAKTPAVAETTPADSKPDPRQDSLPIDVDAYELSADGSWLAILAKDPQTAAEKKKDTDKDDADYVDHDPHVVHLYLLALDKSGAAQGSLLRTDLSPDVQTVAWAPASNRLAVVTEAPNNVGDLRPARAAWILERTNDTWKTTALTKIPATVEGRLAWSQDEKSLLFLAQAQQDAPPGVADLYIADAATGDFHALSKDFNGAIGQVAATDEDAALAAVSLGMTRTVARFPLGGGAPQILRFARSVVTDAATNAARTGWVYQASSSGTPPSLCYAARLADPCTALHTPSVIPSEWRNVAAQTIHWKSGPYTIEGLLYLPPQAEHGKVPLIVDVHGGPTGQFTDSYSPFAQFLVGQGWALLQTNPRGSTGYGPAFAAANKNDLGGGDYNDIMAGVDTVLANFPIDATRTALIGYSYGGEMAGFVEGKTDRFRAIVSGAPVIDQMSEYGTEDSSRYDRWFYGYPWQHEPDAWRQSPIAGVAHAKTPFLLLQGKADTTDPAGQSEEMYRALRQAGVPVELVEYPREDHGPLAMGMFGYPSREPWHGFDARKRLVGFISKQFEATDKK